MSPLDTPSTPGKSPSNQLKQPSTAPAQRHTLLPTPQSPNVSGARLHTPESPTPLLHRPTLTRPPLPSTTSSENKNTESGQVDGRSQQIMTPESSPYAVKDDKTPKPQLPTTGDFSATLMNSRATSNPSSSSFPAPESKPHTTDSAIPPITSVSVPQASTATPQRPSESNPSESQTPTPTPSTLSSPFMDKTSLPRDDFFSTSSSSKGKEKAHAQQPQRQDDIERRMVEQAALEARRGQHAAIEARRPEFFVREDRDRVSPVKRKSSPASALGGVGIMDSPTKGRRIKLFSESSGPSTAKHYLSTSTPAIKLFPDLKLFQETSEESFEESLMAGGYGRYRTAEWVRQPQPIPVGLQQARTVTTGAVKGFETQSEPSPATEKEATPQPSVPLTENELKKRRRLDAFRVLTASNSMSAPIMSTSNSDDSFVNRSGKATAVAGGKKSARKQLYPVELAGRGRVLVDMLPESFESAETTGGGGKRKRKEKEMSPNDLFHYPYGSVVSSSIGHGKREKKDKEREKAEVNGKVESKEKPDWPDSEFPWRLREEEREEIRRREEEERLRWVEKFLDSSDNEEPSSPLSLVKPHPEQEPEEDEDIIPSSQWGVVYDDDGMGEQKPVAYRPGRGKMVRLNADPPRDDGQPSGVRMIRPPPSSPPTMRLARRHSAYFPSDPADARAALLSKRSVRALTFRKEMERRPRSHATSTARHLGDSSSSEEEDDDVPCVCGGSGPPKGAADELVQCDSCESWYHLGCLGIADVGELGGEDEPWFCFRCSGTKEPMFVPTDETPIKKRRLGAEEDEDDPMLYSRSPPDSPTPTKMTPIPKTPTRKRVSRGDLAFTPLSVLSSASKVEPYSFGSGSSISTLSSRGSGYPVTPRHTKSVPRTGHHVVPILDADAYEESPLFDPHSTPSRGFPKFNSVAPFSTPTRKSKLLSTPSRRSLGSMGVSGGFGGPGFLSSALGSWDGFGGDELESPIRRNSRGRIGDD
ncbi:hypothetical protein WG66_011847 [Moniliophthora roreri]|uniref:PHD-type domain-containing protein n=1 Tax=Moniliophthora roreri TaxID=221103 RepID=A0A0W0F286_MONRR|nr:hypothetical protein WG66_011847 [Moniliophthora roreri]